MTGGKSPIGYLKAYMTNLYLSKDSEKVTEAIEEGESVSVTTALFNSLVIMDKERQVFNFGINDLEALVV